MNAECANDGLSQQRGSTNEELPACQSSLSQERGSPHVGVPNVCQMLAEFQQIVLDQWLQRVIPWYRTRQSRIRFVGYVPALRR
jgi:hypothetical protein